MVAYLACKNDIGLLFLPFEHVGKYPRLAARLNITSVMFSMFIFGQVRFTPNVLLSPPQIYTERDCQGDKQRENEAQLHARGFAWFSSNAVCTINFLNF